MPLLDTDILVAFLRGDQQARDKLAEFENKSMHIATSAIVAFELYQGALASSKPEEKLEQVDALLNALDVINFSLVESKLAGKITNLLRTKGAMIGLPDILIGATAFLANERIVSRNLKDYSRIPGLESEKW